MTDCHSTTTRQVIKSKVCQEKWIKINTIYRSPSQKQLREKPYRGDQLPNWPVNRNSEQESLHDIHLKMLVTAVI